MVGQTTLGPDRLADRLADQRWLPRTGANPIQKTPARNAETRVAAASMPSRVLPEPPGPVRVRRRTPSDRSPATSATSVSRPTNELAGRGRLVFEIVRSGGKRALPSWKMTTGVAKSLRRCSPRSTSSSVPTGRGWHPTPRPDRPTRRPRSGRRGGHPSRRSRQESGLGCQYGFRSGKRSAHPPDPRRWRPPLPRRHPPSGRRGGTHRPPYRPRPRQTRCTPSGPQPDGLPGQWRTDLHRARRGGASSPRCR